MRRTRFFSIGTVSVLLILGACTQPVQQPSTAPTASGSVVQFSRPAPQETKESLEKKAQAGDPNAQFELGALYHDLPAEDGQDLAKAKEWFTKSASKGDARAQFNLGVMAYTGEGQKQDFALARQWFEKSVALGNERAAFNLGVMEYRGEGQAKNFKRAMELFQTSANRGFSEAMYNLGVLAAQGEGMPADLITAHAWFALAQEYGSPAAQQTINAIQGSMTPHMLKKSEELKPQLRKNIQSARTKTE